MEDEELNQFLEDMNRHLFHLQLDEFLNMQTIWSRRLKEMDLPEAKKQVMAFVLKQAVLLEDYSINIWKVFDLYFCPADKINKLVDLNELTLWVKNYNEWMADFMQKYLEPEEKSKFYLTVSAYLIQNCSNCDLGVSDVASLFDYQDNYFSTKFKKEFNKTFLEYLKELRMNMAKKLMETTNMKVYEIGNAVGYRNVEHFTRVFKEFTGWTPKEYILKR